MAWLRPPPNDERERRQQLLKLLALGFLVMVAFGLRAYHLDFQSFWRDEVDAVVFARQSIPELLAKFTAAGENGPAYFTLLHYWMAIAGDSEFALRFFSLFSGVLIVPLTYAAGTRIVGRGTGYLAALVAGVAPYYIWYSQEAKMYSLLAALTFLSVYVFLKALDENRPLLWFLYVVATSASLYIHFFAAFILVCEVAVFLYRIHSYRRRFLGFGIALAALILPYLPLAVWELPMLMNPPPSPYPFLRLDNIGTTLLFAFSVGFTGGSNVLAVALFTFLILCAAVLGRKEEAANVGAIHELPQNGEEEERTFPAEASTPPEDDAGPGTSARKSAEGEIRELPQKKAGSRRPIVVLALYLLVPLLSFYAISLRYPMFTERYLIIILPAFQLLAGAGLYVILRRSFILFVACLTLVLIFSWTAIYALQNTPIKADFRDAVRYYEAHGDRDDAVMVIMPYMRRSFDYYHRAPYRWIEPPYANQGVTEEEIASEMAVITGRARRLWVFVEEEDFWDQRGLVKGWLDKEGRLLDEKQFVGVELRYYELPERTLYESYGPIVFK